MIWILLLSVFGLRFGLVKSTCIYAQISIRFRANMVIICSVSIDESIKHEHKTSLLSLVINHLICQSTFVRISNVPSLKFKLFRENNSRISSIFLSVWDKFALSLKLTFGNSRIYFFSSKDWLVRMFSLIFVQTAYYFSTICEIIYFRHFYKIKCTWNFGL